MKSIAYVIMVVLFCFCVSAVHAENITIKDGTGDTTNPWYDPNKEDQEVEPGNVTSQAWDLEAFVLEGTSLTVIGGYNFRDGVAGGGNYPTFYAGDIFIDVTGDVKYGTPTGSAGTTVPNQWGYDYVIHFNKNGGVLTGTYEIYSIDSTSTLLKTAYFGQNNEANPWIFSSGGTQIGGTRNYNYAEGLTDVQISAYGTDVNLLGSSHNALTVDIGFLGSNKDFTVHYTMECGNDNLMGKGRTPVPEPASLMLLGVGLLGLCGARRFQK